VFVKKNRNADTMLFMVGVGTSALSRIDPGLLI
jgi:hypothetical protein